MSVSKGVEVSTSVINSLRDIYDSFNTLNNKKASHPERVAAIVSILGAASGFVAIIPRPGFNVINTAFNYANLSLALGDLTYKSDILIKDFTIDNLDNFNGSVVNFIGAIGGVTINIGIILKIPQAVKWGIILQTYSTTWKTLNEIAKKTDCNMFEWANARSDNEALLLNAICPSFSILRFIAKAYAPAPPPKAAGLPNRRSPPAKVDFRSAQYRRQLDSHLFNTTTTTKAWEDALPPRTVFPTRR